MATVDTPETAPLFGALDSTAITDGSAYNAHVVREITRNANRQAGRGQHLVTLLWPMSSFDWTYNPDGSVHTLHGLRSWVPTTHWIRLVPATPIAFRPGLRRAEVMVDARVSTGHTVLLQVATRAKPYNHRSVASSNNVISLVGTGSDAEYLQDEFLIDPAGYDDIELFVKGLPTSDGANTAEGGTPADRSGLSVTPVYALDYIEATAADGAAWISPGWASSGAEIAFYRADGTEITRRIVTAVDDTNDPLRLYFTPPLTPASHYEVVQGDDFTVFALPTLEVVSFTLAAEPR